MFASVYPVAKHTQKRNRVRWHKMMMMIFCEKGNIKIAADI